MTQALVPITLAGTGSYAPKRVLTNAELAQSVDTSDEWIVTRSGIRERRIAGEGELTSDMAAEAGRRALEAAGTPLNEVDLVIVATTTPDMPNVNGDMTRHIAMVRYTDKIVGRLVLALEETGIRDKTIIIFTTDNGSSGKVTGRRNGISIPGGKSRNTESGICAPFIVHCPGLVPSGVETDALTDFTDLLPTFIELSGAETPSDLIIDGRSIAPLLLGKAEDSPRDWIMALGHYRAKVDEKGIRGLHDYASRVIRDKQYKVWVDENRTITRLHDLKLDPLEELNLIQSTQAEHLRAIQKFRTVLEALPEKDARPFYEPRQALPWDIKYTGDH